MYTVSALKNVIFVNKWPTWTKFTPGRCSSSFVICYKLGRYLHVVMRYKFGDICDTLVMSNAREDFGDCSTGMGK